MWSRSWHRATDNGGNREGDTACVWRWEQLMGGSLRFCRGFRAPPGRLELSAFFLEPTMTPMHTQSPGFVDTDIPREGSHNNNSNKHRGTVGRSAGGVLEGLRSHCS